ncbi:FG-GAP repeat domain-containing protein [Haliangium ochraceum]|nr:VCBS repeat-containing protein [Haliangium ochraceum]
MGLSSYQRTGTPAHVAAAEELHQRSLIEPATPADIAAGPMMPRGLAGVAIFDYDNDGDFDIYATNGAGSSNSLFRNRLAQTGELGYDDVAAQAGVAATAQDSFGTCFGDIDNDGDHDLMVLGRAEANRLFENQGDGSFVELPGAGVGGGARSSTSCSMGDIDNDGRLDIVVANAFDMRHSFAIFAVPYALNEHNQLLRNLGGNTFEDVSESSGITLNLGYPEAAAGITWTAAMADLNRDGATDIVFMDDQGGILAERVGGEDRAYIHVFLNDGAGHFADQPLILNEYSASEWMGVTFGDLDCDGDVDMFATSFGDYENPIFGLPYLRGGSTSRPYYNNGDGSFTDGVFQFGVAATPFGWGAAIFDYDNDGDNDILYHGGLDAANMIVLASNPGVVLENQGCSGVFEPDTTAITTDHLRRNVRGVAVGDIDRNGFVDVVTAANFRVPDEVELEPLPVQYGDAYDGTALYVAVMELINGDFSNPLRVWTGFENQLGNLKLELNGGNGNHWLRVRALGSAGVLPAGEVNRDGIGAQLSFTPQGGQRSTQIVVGGSSHSSQHALEKVFGLARAKKGTLEVLWPGGTRNRLYGVRAGDDVLLPELPCSFDADWAHFSDYKRCVSQALNGLVDAGVLSRGDRGQFQSSALRAYHEHRGQ